MSQPANKTVVWIVIGVTVICLLLFLCAILLGAVALFSVTQSTSQDYTVSPGLQVGDTAPDFTLSLLNGDQVTLSDYRGKPVFVNFWATWCHYCIEEMPLIRNRYERYSGEMVFLVIDEGESPDDVASFVELEGYQFQVLVDPAYSVGDLYLVGGYPMSFFIDSEGIIRYIADGMMEEYNMNDGLRAIGVGQ